MRAPNTPQKLNQKSKKERHYYWLVVGQMYLATALVLTREICPPKKFRLGTAIGSTCRDLGFKSAHPNYEFIWPIVFNLMHGVELWLKGLGNMDHGRYAGIHDVKVLFDTVIKMSGPNQKVVKELYEKTWPTIEKYYYGTYNPLRKDRRHPDKQNEAGRFPEQLRKKKRGGGVYTFQDPCDWVNCDVIDSIANDIRAIEQKFSNAEREIEPQKQFNY